MQPEKKMAFPGDIIATAEEYLPGKNTEEKNGEIIAIKFGDITKDEINLIISVDPEKKEFSIHRGDIVYGQVIKGDQRRFIIRAVAVFQKGYGLKELDQEMHLPLNNFRKTVNSEFMAVGDRVKAFVVRTGDTPEVSVNGQHFGVVGAFCSRCRQPLVKKGMTLYCENCQRTEIRKTADDYGMVDVFNYTEGMTERNQRGNYRNGPVRNGGRNHIRG